MLTVTLHGFKGTGLCLDSGLGNWASVLGLESSLTLDMKFRWTLVTEAWLSETPGYRNLSVAVCLVLFKFWSLVARLSYVASKARLDISIVTR
jgi:hypothetical protein